jgi:hypothetical protein
MSDGYPTKECLEYIDSFKVGRKDPMTLKDIEKLLDVIEENCRWVDFSIYYELGVDSCENIIVKFFYSTGGWSGHEELIGHLKETYFWMFCWEQSRRGGHYIFEINPKMFRRK